MPLVFGNQPAWVVLIRQKLAGAWGQIEGTRLDTAPLSAADLVVPLTLDDARHLRARLAAGETLATLVPAAGVTELCHDKLMLNRALIAHGFGALVPQLPPPDRADGPLILKQRQAAWGRGSRVILGSPDTEARALIRMGSHFLQRYVAGDHEWSTHLLLKGGRIVFHRSIRFEVPAAPHVKGHAQKALGKRWYDEVPQLACLTEVLAALGFDNGTCCIDYRMVAGVPQIFEINPRFGGSLIQQAEDYIAAFAGALGLHGLCPQETVRAAE